MKRRFTIEIDLDGNHTAGIKVSDYTRGVNRILDVSVSGADLREAFDKGLDMARESIIQKTDGKLQRQSPGATAADAPAP